MNQERQLLGLKQPPLTKIDHLLEGELAGRPISFQEIDLYSCSSSLTISHLAFLSFTMDSHFSLVFLRMITSWKNIKLEKGSALRLFDIDLSLHTFGHISPTLFCTIDHFICDELGFMIAKADTHIFSKASNYHILTPLPPFTIAIPKQFIHPAYRTYESNSATSGQHFLPEAIW